MRMVSRFLRSSDRGSALVELGMLLPLTIALLIGAMDLGRVFYSAMAVTHAAGAGVHYGARSLARSQDIAGMVATANNAASDVSGFSATAARSCTCWSAATSTESNMASCSDTCNSPSVVRVYVTVTGTRTFNTLVNYPGIPRTITLNRSAKMRAK